jgi:hypothetical protein
VNVDAEDDEGGTAFQLASEGRRRVAKLMSEHNVNGQVGEKISCFPCHIL